MIIVSMIKYLKKFTEEFPEDLSSTKVPPAGEHMFKIQEEVDRKLS